MVSSPDTGNGDDSDMEEIMPLETSKTEPEEAPIAEAETQNFAGAAESAGESNDDDGTFKVSDLRATWKQKAEQMTKRSQLLNLNDFHMQQRQYRVGDKLKKGEAAEHLHSFRNHDAPTKQKDNTPVKKIPEPEQTKAADRAAMAQYMFLRQSKEKEAKPAAGGIAPHRTPALKAPTPDLLPSKSQDESVTSSTSSKSAKWVKSPTTGKNVIVTDVDEFYAQQHAIHVENERKKREILHISDNKEVSPDKTSTVPSPNYKKSMIPALADSVSEDDSLAIASSSLSMDNADTKLATTKDDTTPRNLAREYDGKQLIGEVEDEEEEEMAKEEGGVSSEQTVQDSDGGDIDVTERVVGASIESPAEEEISSLRGEQEEIKVLGGKIENALEDTSKGGGQTASHHSNFAATADVDESDESNTESALKVQEEGAKTQNIVKKEGVSEIEESMKETSVEVQNERRNEMESPQKTANDAAGNREVDNSTNVHDNSADEEAVDEAAGACLEIRNVHGEEEKTNDDLPSEAQTKECVVSTRDEVDIAGEDGANSTESAIDEHGKAENRTLDETSEVVDSAALRALEKEVNVHPEEESDVLMFEEVSKDSGQGDLEGTASSDGTEGGWEVVSPLELHVEDKVTDGEVVENDETASKSEDCIELASGSEHHIECIASAEEAGDRGEEIVSPPVDDDVTPPKEEMDRAIGDGEIREQDSIPQDECNSSQDSSSGKHEAVVTAPEVTPNEEESVESDDDVSPPLTDSRDKATSPEAARSRASDVLAPKQTITDVASPDKNQDDPEQSGKVDRTDLDVADLAEMEQPATELIDHVPEDVSNASANYVDSDDSPDGRDVEIDLEETVLEQPTTEVIDHMPDNVSMVSERNDDSTASVDGDEPSEVCAEEFDLEETVLEQPTTEVIDHVPDNVSMVSERNDDSTASVDGDEPSEVCAEEFDLEETVLEQPTTEVIDHVPDDVSMVSEGNDDSTASVDGDEPSEVCAEDIDLEETVLEQPTTEVFDHVPDDVSMVSERNDDSTASVDGDEPSEVCAEDIDLEVAVLEQPTTQVIDHVPDDVSNVSTGNDDSTASVDGDVADSVLADFSDHVREDTCAIPWDEGDELVLVGLSRDDPGVPEAILLSGDPEGGDVKAELSDNVVGEEPANVDADYGIDQEGGSENAAEALATSVETMAKELVAEGQVEGNASESPIMDDVVLDQLLASHDETASESSAGEDQVASERANVDGQISGGSASIDEAEVDEDFSYEDEVGPHDESILDELLASRDETVSQSSREAGDDEDLAKAVSAKDDAGAVLDDINASAVVEELLASHDDDSNPQPSDEDDGESGNLQDSTGPASTRATETRDLSEYATGGVESEDLDDEEKESEIKPGAGVARLIENLLADESALDVFEETEGDTSGIHSIQQDEEPLLHADDRPELHDESAICYAPSKDNDELSPTEVIAEFIRPGSYDESIEVVQKKSEIGSTVSSATGSDSSEDRRPDHLSCAPSAGSTDKPAATNPGAKVEVDYKNVDYRGFVFVVHKSYGLILLHCTRKKKKGPHFQLPGGHIDEPEFFAAAEQSRDGQTQLLLAARAGAARELYEETGMDVRYQLDRMEPAALRNTVEVDKNGKPILTNELKHRLYFFLAVTDEDFWSSDRGDSDAGKMHPMGAALGCEGSQLMVSR